ncbi:chromobox protein homolog 1 [Drosophila mauritiana]|uniref:Chromobox protein homolog 1 n=1 Tax=Drosophila mauritiana TaxID=7226 RepID=A0A6P8LBQ2_DROMA|nr:chromobox protein homolog 1 [Drosophila mauritiana]
MDPTKSKTKGNKANSTLTSPTPSPEKQPNGFDLGLEPLRILGACDWSGELTFLMQWKGCDQAGLVPATVLNNRCPQMVIAFYEERIVFKDDCDEDSLDSDCGYETTPSPKKKRAPSA